jgi:hypothetical protein
MAKRLEPNDLRYLVAAEGWLELGNHLEANEELENIAAKKGKPLGKLLGVVAVPCQPNATEMMLACA